MPSIRMRNDQERYCFASEERHALENRLVERLPAMRKQVELIAQQAGWAKHEYAICVRLLETLLRALPSAFADITSCARQIVVLVGDQNDIDIDEFSLLTDYVRDVLCEACLDIAPGERQVAISRWLAALTAKIQVEFVVASYWSLPRKNLVLDDFARWLNFLRVEQYCEQVSIVKTDKIAFRDSITAFSYDVQSEKWMVTSPSTLLENRLNEQDERYTQRVEFTTDLPITIILHRPHRNNESSRLVADELAALFQRFYQTTFSLQPQHSFLIWKKMKEFYRKIVHSTHPNDLFSLVASDLPSLIGWKRSALFVHIPMVDVFKGIYGCNIDMDELRGVIESKDRFLEICEPAFSKPAVITAEKMIASNYINTFRLGELIVVPFCIDNEVVSVLLMDNNGSQSRLDPFQFDLICEIKSVVEDTLHVRFYNPLQDRATRPRSLLTRRELEIIELMARGLENKEIALRLHISSYTVREHTSNILGKLAAINRTEAVVKAFRLGLVT